MKKFNINENKKAFFLSLLVVLTIVLTVVGATYAYFKAQGGVASQTNVNVRTSTTDSLIFTTGNAINFTADQESFKKGAGNKAGSSYAKAVLKANDGTNYATANYYVYLNISNNNFEYTQENKTAELILKVTDPDGNEVKNIDGLTYVTVNGVSGFDVTDKNGLIRLVNNHEIVSEGTKEEQWNVELTFVNLDQDQTKNAGKIFDAKLEITKENKIKDTLLADLCKGKTLSDCVKAQYTGTQGENNLYLHDNSLTNGAKDNSYRYAGPSDTTNNFVCFGYDSQDGSCPGDNLYRIIGVFGDEVKLIKYDYAKSTLLGTDGDYGQTYQAAGYGGTNKGQNSQAEIGGYYWNRNGTNTWSESQLNTINLNKNYINKIDENGTKWSEKISDHTWKVGGNTYNNISKQTAPNAYQNEINSPATNKTVNAKVGLMYVSDYGYAASSSSWSTALSSYNNATVTANNWMYMGLYEWTLAPRTDYSHYAFFVNYTGDVNRSIVDDGSAVRPVLYLKSTIGYGGGSGTAAKPILVK